MEDFVNKVLDSWAIIAFFEGDPRGEKVKPLLQHARDKKARLAMSVVNWGEVLSVIERRYGSDKLLVAEQLMDTTAMEIVEVNKEQAREAAHLRVVTKLHYTDCFAAALALSRQAVLVTGDKNFHNVEDRLKIEWL